jgi:hypothetical protein
MEFRYQYMVAMQDQNPKMYCWLGDRRELDRFVNLKAQEASRLYQSLLSEGPQPPTLMSERGSGGTGEGDDVRVSGRHGNGETGRSEGTIPRGATARVKRRELSHRARPN